MAEARRHRLIWAAVAGGHAVLFGAILAGGFRPAAEPVREGGLVMISLIADPVAVPGEALGGPALGAGPVQPRPSPALPAPVGLLPVPSRPVAGASSPSPTPTPPALAGPEAPLPGPISAAPEMFVPPAFQVHEEPTYPERARRAGVEGEVVVKILLSAQGDVIEVRLVRSSGSRLLDDAALAAAHASRFTPARRDQVPVEAEAMATYRFELR